VKSLLSVGLIIFALSCVFSQRQIVTFNYIGATKAFNGKVFFVGAKAGVGPELLVTDGTPGNVTVVKDINGGPAGSSPDNLTVFNGQLYFTAYGPGQSYRSVWKTDGTSEGTQQVYFEQYSNAAKLTVFKNKLYFTTDLGKIVRTDGLITETFFQSDYTSSNIPVLIATDQYLYFTPYSPTFYRFDGTTRVDFPIAPSDDDLYFRNLFAVGNKVIAVKATSYDETVRIYALDNSDIGPGNEETDWVLLKELKAPATKSQYIANFTVVGDMLFFSYRTFFDVIPPSDELWVCDGTVAGTKMLKTFPSQNSVGADMRQFFAFQNKLFFRNGLAAANSLWTSDGTVAGTVKFHDVKMALPGYEQPVPILVTENKFYFSSDANDLWSSDGTAAGTKLMIGLEDAQTTIPPHHFAFVNNVLYVVTTQNFSSTLWSSVSDADISVTYNSNPVISGMESLSLSGSMRNVNPGSCKTDNLVIINKGALPLYFSDILVSGSDFYLAKQNLPEMLAPNATITIQLMFNPVTSTTSRGTLTLVSNDSDEAQFMIPLFGNKESGFGSGTLCNFDNNDYVKSLKPAESAQPIVLTGSTITEGSPIGTMVGEFSVPAAATFTLVAGEGDSDNAQFTIEANKLKTASIFNYDTRTLFTIHVKAVTPTGTSEGSFRVRVLNAGAGFLTENCDMRADRISFSYTSITTNSLGYLFATTSAGKILRSINGGNTWEVFYSGPYYSYLNKIMFIGDTGYAAGYSTLLKSEDNGDTWFSVYIPSYSDNGFTGFGMYFFNKDEGYIGTDRGDILYTQDGGRSWDTRLTGWFYDVRDIWFISKDIGFASVDFGALFKTTTGGRTWSEVNLSTFGFSTRVSDMVFFNDQTGLMTTNNGLGKTTNGGQSWSLVPASPSGQQIEFVDANVGFMYGDFTTFSKTTDGGSTWEYLFNVPTNSVSGLVKTNNKIYLVAKDSYQSHDSERLLAVSSDEGTTWTTVSRFTHKSLYRMKFTDGGRGLITGEDGIVETRDNGLSWRSPGLDLASVADFLFLDANTLILVSSGQIYKSTDGGITTHKVLNAPNKPEEVPYLPAGKLYNFYGTLYAVSWYAVYRSTDEGETWTLASTDPGYYTQGMHFVSATTGYRIGLFGDVQKTTDSGTTWPLIYQYTSGAADPFNAVFFVSEQRGFKGGRYLEGTTDGGITWQRIYYPWYDDIIMIHFETESHGFVVTRAGYVYETEDGTLTWKEIYSAPSSERVFGAEFINHEILLVGEYGFATRINMTPHEAELPGYIYGPAQVCVGAVADYRIATNYNSQTQWSTTVGNMNDQADKITLTFPESGEYTISARHFTECSISKTRLLTVVVSEPEVPEIDGPETVQPGSKNIAYSVANATEDDQFLWEVKLGTGISPNDDNTLIVDWANTIGAGIIKVLVLNQSGCRAYARLPVGVGLLLGSDDDLSKRVNVYPNPADGDTKIYSTYSGDLSIRLIDATGREYQRAILTRESEKILMTKALPSGLYFVEVSHGHQAVTKKLIRK